MRGRRSTGQLLAVGVALLPLVLPAAALAGPAPGLARASPAIPAPQHVLIVSEPGVTWEDVAAGRAPVLRGLAAKGSVAALSIRTVDSPTDLASAYATVGAGNRARGLGPGDDTFTPNAAPSPGGGLAIAEWHTVVQDNAHLHYGAVPGALGTALHAAGIRTGVVGNADSQIAGDQVPFRYAALALAGATGTVDVGDVGEDLSPGTALAHQQDGSAVAAATQAALASAGVVLVELTETLRTGDALDATGAGPQAGNPVRAGAVGADDAALGQILASVDLGRDTVLVLAPSDLGTGPGVGPDGLMVAVGAGVGMSPGGWLTSATTRRNGIVTLADVAPGVLQLLGVKAPASMTGQALHSAPGPGSGAAATTASTSRRIDVLVGLDTAALHYRSRLAPFIAALSAVGLLMFGLTWGLLARRWPAPPGRRARTALSVAGLAVGAAPLAALAQAAIGAERWAVVPAAASLVVADALVVAAALAGPWRRRALGPAAAVTIATLAAIAGDLVTGAHGQLLSLVGYSPIEAGRFYGLAPLSFAVLAPLAVAVAGVAAMAAGPRLRVPLALGLGALATALAGAPMLGAKFGAILTLVPAFGLLALLVGRRRIRVGTILGIGVAAAAVGIGFGLIDALRPVSSQTHIGRFVKALLGGGGGGVSDVLDRKAATSFGVYWHTPATLLIPAALALVLVAALRTPPWLRAQSDAVGGLREGVLAAVAAGVIAALVNDSGVAIPAFSLAIGVPLVLSGLLRIDGPPAAPEP